MEECVLAARFNATRVFVTIATDIGYRVCSCDPFQEMSSWSKKGGATIVEMISTDLTAISTSDSPTKVFIRKKDEFVAEFTFKTPVTSIRCRLDRILVALEHKVFAYSIGDLSLLNQYETAENARGILSVSRHPNFVVMACLGQIKGQVRVENHTLRKTSFITAHESELACIELSDDGKLLATASTKGTIIRLFNTLDGTLLQEFRRGAERVDIRCISFCPRSQWLGVSSDRSTVHVFAIKDNDSAAPGAAPEAASEAAPAALKARLFSKVSKVSNYLASKRSKVQILIPEARVCAVAFSQEKNTVFILSSDGSLFKRTFA